MCASCGCTGKVVSPRTKASDNSKTQPDFGKVGSATGKGK